MSPTVRRRMDQVLMGSHMTGEEAVQRATLLSVRVSPKTHGTKSSWLQAELTQMASDLLSRSKRRYMSSKGAFSGHARPRHTAR